MRISRLLMPAATLAGALALAGCGGGSSTPAGDGSRSNLSDDQKRQIMIAKRTEECGDMGKNYNPTTDACVDRVVDMTAKEARDAAIALRAKIAAVNLATENGGGDVEPPTTVTEKKIGAFRAQGLTFSGLADDSNTGGNLIADTAIPSGSNKDYYILEAHPSGVMATGFSTDAGVDTIDNGKTVTGSYRGISGTFKCAGDNGADCTSESASGGNFELSAGWLFKPGSATARAQGAALAEWGWWINPETNTNDASDDTIQLVYRDANTSAALQIRTAWPHNGPATYSGDAYGQYAVVERGSGSASGAFEAKAKLTATFGGTFPKLKGEIHDFNVGTGWKVILEENKNAPDSTSNFFSGETAWNVGSDAGLDPGAWEASTFGTDGDGTDGSVPSHILGGFTAQNGGDRMAGAFGTKNDKLDD